jgi:hypothetical protein
MGTIEARPAKSDKLRYRAYFWLMNASAFGAAFLLAELAVSRFTGVDYLGLPETIRPPILFTVVLLISLVPFILMVASFMRDDYAEGLWKRTLVVLAYCAAVIAPLLFFVPWVLYFAFVWLELTPPEGYYELLDGFFYGSSNNALLAGKTWVAFMISFVLIFQFLRWRDSR